MHLRSEHSHNGAMVSPTNHDHDGTGRPEGRPAAGDTESVDVTIDELARRTGLMVSTIRLYQHRGLLAPPQRRGRVGYYGPGHLARLRAIADLQERGFSLAAIKEVLDRAEAGDSLRSIVGLGDSAHGRSVWAAEPAMEMSLAELAEHLPAVEMTAAVVQRVVGLGLIELLPDGRVRVPSPSLLSIGGELMDLGIPFIDILDEYEALRAQTDQIAARFTELFRNRLWAPVATRSMTVAEVTPILELLERLAPLAERVTSMSLRHSLQASAESFARAETARLGIEIPTGQPPTAGSERSK